MHVSQEPVASQGEELILLVRLGEDEQVKESRREGEEVLRMRVQCSED